MCVCVGGGKIGNPLSLLLLQINSLLLLQIKSCYSGSDSCSRREGINIQVAQANSDEMNLAKMK